MGNFNPNYFDRKAGSLERAVLDAINGVQSQINEASVTTDLDDDPKLFKQIEKMGVKVKMMGKPKDGYVEVQLSGPQAKIDAANKKLNLLPEDYDLDEKYTQRQRNIRDLSKGKSGGTYQSKDGNTAGPSIRRAADDQAKSGGAASTKGRKYYGTDADGYDKRDDHDDARGVQKRKGEREAAKTDKERKEKQTKMKMDLLKKRQRLDRERERKNAPSNVGMSGRSNVGGVGVRESMMKNLILKY